MNLLKIPNTNKTALNEPNSVQDIPWIYLTIAPRIYYSFDLVRPFSMDNPSLINYPLVLGFVKAWIKLIHTDNDIAQVLLLEICSQDDIAWIVR